MSSAQQAIIDKMNAVRARLWARSATNSNWVEYRVNTIFPPIAKILSRSSNSYTELTSRLNHTNSHTVYIGNHVDHIDPDALYFSMDHHNNMLTYFSDVNIGLNRNTIIHSNVFSRSCNDITFFNDLHVNQDIRTHDFGITFDNINKHLSFVDHYDNMLHLKVKQIKIRNHEGYYSQLDDAGIISSYDSDGHLIGTYDSKDQST